MRTGLFVLIVWLVPVSTAWAQISPGELARPHADLEGISNCTQCHTLGGGPDAEKCLQCHREIQQLLNQKKGYHSFVTQIQNKACFECHSDHHGRAYELIFWRGGKDNFDHRQTGYTLEGKHSAVSCEKCHNPQNIVQGPRKLNEKVDINKTLLGLGRACLNCHDDEHRGQLPQDCLRCHSYDGWKPAAKFSHQRARFKLTGQHQKVDCQKCHPQASIPQDKISSSLKRTYTRFVDLQFDACISCHRDVHRGKFGSNCTSCHSTAGWHQLKQGNFDHSRTRFPLIGLHHQVACEKCHVGGVKVKAAMRFERCADCHRDVHLGQFSDRADGGRCESCHNEFGFVPARFDVEQHRNTDYPLTGAHLAVPCMACHRHVDIGTARQRTLFDFADVSCQGCHEDVHKGQFAAQVQTGGCEACHQTSAWQDTKFDHDVSRFPLTGKHRNVACGKCHKVVDAGTARERMLFRPMQRTCENCHEDIHQRQFQLTAPPKTCDQCHTPESWLALQFDHDRDALFKLRGAHENTACRACHKPVRKGGIEFILFKPMDRRCKSCHSG